jgi:ABC-2 type transport system permease protein
MINYYSVALYGMVRKEVVRFMRIWMQTLLPSVVTTILYFLVFGEVMGARIGSMAGFGYTVFITPGLVMLAIITNAYSNVVSSFYGARFVRSIEELLVSPVPNWMIVAGFTIGGVVRGVLTGLLVMFIGLLFAHFTVVHVFLSGVLIILCSVVFALAGLLNGIYAKKFDDLVIVPTFVLTPLIYLGGVFFSIQELSTAWRYLAYLNPIHYLIDSFRYALLGVAPAEPLWVAFLGVIFSGMLLYGYIMYLLNNGKLQT